MLGRVPDQDTRSLIGGGGAALVIRMASLAVAYAFAVVVGQTLGAEVWGQFTLALAMLLIGGVLSRLGLDTATLRLVAEEESAGGYRRQIVLPAVTVVLPWSLVVACLSFLCADIVAGRIFKADELAPALRVASFGIPALAVAQVLTQALRGLKRIRTYILLEQFSRFALPLVGVPWLLVGERGAVDVVGIYVLGTYGTAACASVAWLKAAPGREQRRGRVAIGTMMRIGFPLLLANSMDYLKGWIDVLMLGVFVSGADVGRYNVARRLASLVSLPLVALNSIAAPQFAGLFGAGEGERLKRLGKRTAVLALGSALPIGLALCLFPSFWLGLFGNEFTEAGLPMRILILGYLVSSGVGSVGYLLQMCGLQTAFQNLTLLVTTVGALLNYLLIPHLGVTGAALSTAFSVTLWNLLALLLVRWNLGFWSLPSRGPSAPEPT